MLYVAIGANLPGHDGCSPLETCRRAAAALDGAAGMRLSDVSPGYESAPMPPSGQPAYVNGVAALTGDGTPEHLLAALQAMEQQAGRERGERNAARTLDLDIVAMGTLVRTAPDPVLPHPRMHLRAFVLAPLADIAPQWRHPILHQTASELLAALDAQDIRRLTSRLP